MATGSPAPSAHNGPSGFGEPDLHAVGQRFRHQLDDVEVPVSVIGGGFAFVLFCRCNRTTPRFVACYQLGRIVRGQEQAIVLATMEGQLQRIAFLGNQTPDR